MTYLFYRRDPGAQAPAVSLPDGTEVRTWCPARDGFPRRGPMRNVLWWAFSKLDVLASREFTEVTLWRDDRLLHRLIVTPRWARFPFMEKGDLQLGDLWTRPDARGEGLAKAAIDYAHRHVAKPGGRLWYVVDLDNLASRRLIESFGYRLVGTGRRTAPFGIRAIGRYRLTEPAL